MHLLNKYKNNNNISTNNYLFITLTLSDKSPV